jgi:hypothetical protein
MEKEDYFNQLREVSEKIIALHEELIDDNRIGIDISQPGIIKEVIIASILEHRIKSTKNQHDAEDFDNHNTRYEYLSSELKGGSASFQFDRTTRDNLNDKIKRNKAVYCAVFDPPDSLNISRIWELVISESDDNCLYKFLKPKLNNASHYSFSERNFIEESVFFNPDNTSICYPFDLKFGWNSNQLTLFSSQELQYELVLDSNGRNSRNGTLSRSIDNVYSVTLEKLHRTNTRHLLKITNNSINASFTLKITFP